MIMFFYTKTMKFLFLFFFNGTAMSTEVISLLRIISEKKKEYAKVLISLNVVIIKD